MSRPLWRILVQVRQPDAPLTCADCFALLEILAEEAVRGVDLGRLYQAVRGHLARCPGCREYYQQRLRELEGIVD